MSSLRHELTAAMDERQKLLVMETEWELQKTHLQEQTRLADTRLQTMQSDADQLRQANVELQSRLDAADRDLADALELAANARDETLKAGGGEMSEEMTAAYDAEIKRLRDQLTLVEQQLTRERRQRQTDAAELNDLRQEHASQSARITQLTAADQQKQRDVDRLKHELVMSATRLQHSEEQRVEPVANVCDDHEQTIADLRRQLREAVGKCDSLVAELAHSLKLSRQVADQLRKVGVVL